MSFSRFMRGAGRDLIETAILALLIFFAVRSAVQNFKVEGFSMDPSLENGEYILVDKVSYGVFDLGPLERFIPFVDSGDDGFLFEGPQRGDVIVFEAPIAEGRDFIKRVIGVPGDQIEVRDGVVYVNGQAIDEPYITHKGSYDWPADGSGPATVPDKHYFVLGDNRDNSSDSHIWGFLPADKVVGRAWVSYWPTSSIGLAPHHAIP
ncbi:MAG TPA: signal peptidase I [Dehalococcoidia bacterium]|nr:signal peptidase I [Dehalococcoidia bacterium]